MRDNLDTTPYIQAQWIEYLDTVARLDYMTAVKRQITERLELHEGDVVLDAGCGTGDDAPSLVAHVRASGRVVGLDASEETGLVTSDDGWVWECTIGCLEDPEYAARVHDQQLARRSYLNR